MTNLTAEQESLRDSIKKSATIWAIALGLIVGAIAYFLLGSQGFNLQAGGGALAGLLTAGGIYRKNISSGTADAKCAKCNAAFSVTRIDRQETLLDSTPKKERKELENGDIETKTWTEELYDVEDTFECSSCNAITYETHHSTRQKDVETTVKPAGKKGSDTGKGNAKGKAPSKGKSKT